MRRSGLSMMLAALALTLPCLLSMAHAATISFSLEPASAAIATCVPQATADVTVFPKRGSQGVDSLHLDASGLPPDTDFAVFLTQNSAFDTPPFGAVEYIGDFTTSGSGNGSLKVDAIIVEAFSSTLVDGTRVRADLNNVVFWFAEPAQAQAACGLTAVTPFDGDGEAGPAAMSSRGAPLPPP
jgi:hypothetical protein